jgi:DNA-binding MarR family transcriptional regulator
VDKLVNLGLMVRCPHPEDRRVIVVKLTEEGDQIHRQHNQLHLELMHDITGELSSEQVTLLTNCLNKMNQEF